MNICVFMQIMKSVVEIDTQWNVNTKGNKKQAEDYIVEIDTQWNVNIERLVGSYFSYELKQIHSGM